MTRFYIDCGTHLGEGLKKHIEQCGIDESWDIYTFEANTFTYNMLQAARTTIQTPPPQYRWIKWNNIQYFNRAVWINDGTCQFSCSTVANRGELLRDPGYSSFMRFHDGLLQSGDLLLPHQGNSVPVDGSSTLLPEHMEKQLKKAGDNFQKSLNWNQKITVESFDFSTWLKNTVTQDDYVICKIDIEGGEFEVLKKCIADDTLKLIDVLDVEFHDFDNKAFNVDRATIMNAIKIEGITFRNW